MSRSATAAAGPSWRPPRADGPRHVTSAECQGPPHESAWGTGSPRNKRTSPPQGHAAPRLRAPFPRVRGRPAAHPGRPADGGCVTGLSGGEHEGQWPALGIEGQVDLCGLPVRLDRVLLGVRPELVPLTEPAVRFVLEVPVRGKEPEVMRAVKVAGARGRGRKSTGWYGAKSQWPRRAAGASSKSCGSAHRPTVTTIQVCAWSGYTDRTCRPGGSLPRPDLRPRIESIGPVHAQRHQGALERGDQIVVGGPHHAASVVVRQLAGRVISHFKPSGS